MAGYSNAASSRGSIYQVPQGSMVCILGVDVEEGSGDTSVKKGNESMD